MAQFLALVNDIKPDIIFLVETWLKLWLDNSVFSLPDYTVVRRDRGLIHDNTGRHIQGGGIACLVRNSFSQSQSSAYFNY